MAVGDKTEHLILDAVSSYRDDILDFTTALVSIPTENPPGTSYRPCIEAIAIRLREIGLDATVL